MSALQQSPICGLEEPEIPLSRRGPPGTSRRGTRPAKPVASYCGGFRGGSRELYGFARAVVAAAVVTRSATGEQDGVMKALSRLAAIAASAGGVLASAGAA